MEVTETRSEGLARELKVVVPATTLNERLTAYLDDMRGKVRLKGFRPGKVPMAHLHKMYGKSAMAEVINTVLTESVQQAVEGRSETPALQPDIDLDEAAMPEVIDGKSDLAFDIKYEVLPAIEVTGLDQISVERPVVVVSDEEVDAEITTLAERNRSFETAERPAESGDRVTIDFVGKVDDVAFDGGTAEDVDVEIGANRFIPGFEEQLIGAKAGEPAVITVTFPEDYPAEQLAGKEAKFDVTVKSVSAAQDAVADDALAERLGLESLDKLKDAMRQQIESAYGQASRQKTKRALLDALDEKFTFELPQKLVETEFNNIWNQVQQDMAKENETFEAEGEKSEESVRADYTKIAERRVRLGLLLSEVGQNANVEVTDEEVQGALQERLRQYPGREREVFEIYRKNPQAIAGLRAPIFEDKVIDYMLELVTVTDKPVSKEELLKPDEDDLPGHDHDHDHHHDHDHNHDHDH
ncbi:trigger factor [Acuticoccus sp. MNP-M23]|uniref:trigger factor n=1 Tax=Acuticoccus sp. MNP-M23 TaxID=3072793 RepID=UPI002814FD9C|nr:trigger factor [Acuticoccus sp. MNP-M23]WMS42077.1 trigger factor [Acuticoccus sp. MNP-M23]